MLAGQMAQAEPHLGALKQHTSFLALSHLLAFKQPSESSYLWPLLSHHLSLKSPEGFKNRDGIRDDEGEQRKQLNELSFLKKAHE